MDIATRITRLDWKAIEQTLWDLGYAKTPAVLTPDECDELSGLYTDPRRFRRRIDVARHRFGVGEYQYFAAPLPPLVQSLRLSTYPPLAAIANRWMGALRLPQHLRHPRAARNRGARLSPRADASRRQPRQVRRALCAGRYFSRREVRRSTPAALSAQLRTGDATSLLFPPR